VVTSNNVGVVGWRM